MRGRREKKKRGKEKKNKEKRTKKKEKRTKKKEQRKKNKEKRKNDMYARSMREAPLILGSIEMIILVRCTYNCSR